MSKRVRDFIFELGIEEIPAQYVKTMADSFQSILTSTLKNLHIHCESIQVYYTPRRLAAYVRNMASSQDDVKAALDAGEYDTIISLSAGDYTLPATLPAGLRITGAGAKVMLTVNGNTLSANDVEFDHVTFGEKFDFTGWGSFEEVTFAEGTTINATHDTVLVDCVNPPAESDNVSIVTSVPTPTPATSSATTP